jgi:hypothetical protein
MPTLSASDYTRFVKYRAANVSPIRAVIQTRDNVALSQSIINANLLTSQAAFVVTPPTVARTTLTAVVTDATREIVTEARTNVITAASGDGEKITYTTSQAHGLTTGDIVTITGLGVGTFTGGNANQADGVVTVTSSTQFQIFATPQGDSTGTGSIALNGTGLVYYKTSIANGLAAGDVITISGLDTFNATNATVVARPTATTFVLSSDTTGTAETGKSGAIAQFVYYTTDSGGIDVTQKVTISGLSSFNVIEAPIFRGISSTLFMIQSTQSGTTVTGGTGVLTLTRFTNTTTSITSNARVIPIPVVQTRSTADAKSTVSYAGTSGALGSSRVQRVGGLPTGFRNSQGTYHRIPQSAGW